MVKQYIGARYVPIFDGAYNPEKAYEPLTIVTYLNNSYTSKKTVPAGTLPSNMEYWALTGNYNAQVEEYREEVESVKERVEDLELYVDGTNSVVNVEEFLNSTELVFDNVTAAIQYLFNNYDVIIFSGNVNYELDYTDNVSAVGLALYLLLPKGKKVIGNGVTFTLKANDNPNYSGIHLMGDNYISGVNIVGDKVTHNYQGSTTHEWGYGFDISPYAFTQDRNPDNVTIIDCSASMCTGDGFYIHASNVRIINSKSFGNRRQGMSITSGSNITVDGCEIYNIGSYNDITGTAPMSGIDFENEGQIVSDIEAIVKNTKIYNCTKDCVEVTGGSYSNDITIEDCDLIGGPNNDSYVIAGSCESSRISMFNNRIDCSNSDYAMPLEAGELLVDGLKANVKSFLSFANKNCTFMNVTITHVSSAIEVSRECFRFTVDNPQNLVFSNILVEDSAVALLHDVDNLKTLANATISAQNISFKNSSVLPYGDTLVSAFYGSYKDYEADLVVAMPSSTPDGNKFELGTRLIANVPNNISDTGIASGGGRIEITSNNNKWLVSVLSTCDGFGFTVTPDGSISASNNGANYLKSGINYYNTDNGQFEHKA